MQNLKFLSKPSAFVQLLTFILLATSLSACASFDSTGYRERVKQGDNGYTVRKVEGDSWAATYVGNKYTPQDHALAYTMLAAYSACRAENKIAFVPTPADFTKKTTTTEIGSTTTPILNSNGTTSYATQTYAYPVDHTLPAYLTVFLCRSNYLSLAAPLNVESIRRDLIHNTTKDFKGGILIKDPTSKVAGITIEPFRVDDVITRVSNKRVEDYSDVKKILNEEGASPNISAVNVEVVRADKLVRFDAPVENISKKMAELENTTIATLCKLLPHRRDLVAVTPLPPICPPTVK